MIRICKVETNRGRLKNRIIWSEIFDFANDWLNTVKTLLLGHNVANSRSTSLSNIKVGIIARNCLRKTFSSKVVS